MARAVLDASAVVAFLLKEKGSETILRLILAGCVISAPNLVEALTIARREGHQRPSDDLYEDLLTLGIEVEPTTIEDVLEAVWLLKRSDEILGSDPKLRVLSLGDALCIAVGRRLELPVVFSNSTWEVLECGVQLLPFR